jgi:hypothetical protein
MEEFDAFRLDYMCYSFFRASQLNVSNLLPLRPVERRSFREVAVSSDNAALLGRISPNYYTFSLLCLISVDYLKAVLCAENRRWKIFSRIAMVIVTRMLRPHRSRRLFKRLNDFLAPLNMMLCRHHPATPFNLEKLWFEWAPTGPARRYGIPSMELYANYDDDNGAFEESLIKRGLYPFHAHTFEHRALEGVPSVVYRTSFRTGDRYDCTYYSHNARISKAPILSLRVIRGAITVEYQTRRFSLHEGDVEHFYSNLRPALCCDDDAEVEVRIHDEAFSP